MKAVNPMILIQTGAQRPWRVAPRTNRTGSTCCGITTLGTRGATRHEWWQTAFVGRPRSGVSTRWDNPTCPRARFFQDVPPPPLTLTPTGARLGGESELPHGVAGVLHRRLPWELACWLPRYRRVLESKLVLRPTIHASQKWEHGSSFHWLHFDAMAECTPSPWRGPAVYAGSGRDAIRCLLTHGMARRGWRRVWVPSYFCQEVVSSMCSTGIDVRQYPDNPLLPIPAQPGQMEPGDVFFVVNYFGLRSQPRLPETDGIELVEDHTHDPWSHWAFNSPADYCIASLRKTLPVPDGAVLWSPRGKELPPAPAPTLRHQAASTETLAAMLLKLLYLEGHRVDKNVFLELARQAERNIAAGEISGISPVSAAILSNLPIASWREQRGRNQQRLCVDLASASWATVLSGDGDGSCPFTGMVVCDTAARCQHIRRGLIARDVYPAVLWPLEDPVLPGIPETDRALCARLVAIHCDMRYSRDDMDKVAALLVKLGNAWHG